jgi:hypothetical protein
VPPIATLQPLQGVHGRAGDRGEKSEVGSQVSAEAEDGRRMVEGAGWRTVIGRLQELNRLASASRLRGRQGIGQRAQVTAFRGATGVKIEGVTDHVAGTAGLEVTARAGLTAVRTLMRVHLKTEPALLAAWNLAARVERPPKPPKAPSTSVAAPVPVESSSGS